MTLSPENFKDIQKLKKNTKNFHICPLCEQKIEIGVELETLNKLHEEEYFPYPHAVLHGDPLHILLCYIDKNMTVRYVSEIKSVEVSRDYHTFKQLMEKWANPY